ncbi:hypothetical protein GGR57DRAFT_479935 [Xylariaceae sp. FL1272]|nr:hypothetical protein GGR57DRAFT_479935 [Xylariaceae sp. FL1272]
MQRNRRGMDLGNYLEFPRDFTPQRRTKNSLVRGVRAYDITTSHPRFNWSPQENQIFLKYIRRHPDGMPAPALERLVQELELDGYELIFTREPKNVSRIIKDKVRAKLARTRSQYPDGHWPAGKPKPEMTRTRRSVPAVHWWDDVEDVDEDDDEEASEKGSEYNPHESIEDDDEPEIKREDEAGPSRVKAKARSQGTLVRAPAPDKRRLVKRKEETAPSGDPRFDAILDFVRACGTLNDAYDETDDDITRNYLSQAMVLRRVFASRLVRREKEMEEENEKGKGKASVKGKGKEMESRGLFVGL